MPTKKMELIARYELVMTNK